MSTKSTQPLERYAFPTSYRAKNYTSLIAILRMKERKIAETSMCTSTHAYIHTHTNDHVKKKKKKKQKRPIVFHVFPKRATLSFVYRGAFHFHALVILDDATRRIVSSTQLPIYGERSRATIPDNHRGHSSRDEHEVKPGERED